MTEAKPYAIPKQVVWDAYKKVKANRGAAGVDGQSLVDFEKDLKGISTSSGIECRPAVTSHLRCASSRFRKATRVRLDL